MQKNKLKRCEDRIVRILEHRNESVLVVDCLRKSMPVWMQVSELELYQECTEEELMHAVDREVCGYDSLDSNGRRIAHERFTMIAGILPFVGDEKQRSFRIAEAADLRKISKQTIRHYLWLYLAYQEIAALAPKQKRQPRPLTKDEKNMRWALNRFFYTRQRNSLATAYTLMLKEKYCDASGKLPERYPSIHQFRYFYRKHNRLQTQHISRDGLKDYQRNHRPLLGDGVQAFAPSVGVGMLDSTVCDIYLVNDAGKLVGRPILTACVDAYSGICCGYCLSWEGGVYSLRRLMLNVITDKMEWCEQFGISLQKQDWDCNQLPGTLVTDKGSEYKSQNFEQLAELGVTIVNLPSYRPELKGMVEKFFDLIQSSYKQHLKGKGVIEPDFQQRGAHDYRKDACLTMSDFEKIILHCIIYYNSRRVVRAFPYTEQMIEEGVQPLSSNIWNWGKTQAGANLISVSREDLILTLLPRTTGKFARNGLQVNKMRYRRDDCTERYLKGGDVAVAYNSGDVSCVWVVEDGKFACFELIEGRFTDMNLDNVEAMKQKQKAFEKELSDASLQGRIELAQHIGAIAGTSGYQGKTCIQGIRQNRKREQNRDHVDLLKGGAANV